MEVFGGVPPPPVLSPWKSCCLLPCPPSGVRTCRVSGLTADVIIRLDRRFRIPWWGDPGDRARRSGFSCPVLFCVVGGALFCGLDLLGRFLVFTVWDNLTVAPIMASLPSDRSYHSWHIAVSSSLDRGLDMPTPKVWGCMWGCPR